MFHNVRRNKTLIHKMMFTSEYRLVGTRLYADRSSIMVRLSINGVHLCHASVVTPVLETLVLHAIFAEQTK